MTMKKRDCRGIACPQPVLITKELIEQFPDKLVEIRVDNEASRENVTRFFKSRGWAVSLTEAEDGSLYITGAPGTCESSHGEGQNGETPGQKVLMFIPTDRFGTGDDELGRALMKNFILTLREMGEDLWRIILVNGGVRLAVKGSPVVGALRQIEKSGVDILVCGTCLEYFDLLEKKEVGQTTNMLDIVTSMQIATKVVRI